MARHLRSWGWLVVVCGVAGCGDNMTLVVRDYYNIQHEVIDNMVYIVDEPTAKKFNKDYEVRLKVKEEAIEARREKIINNLFVEADKVATRELIKQLDEVDLKKEIDNLDNRFRVMQNRLRRVMVKMVEDKAALGKAGDQSFTVSSLDVCPSLTNLERGAKFVKGINVSGLLGGAAPMMVPGAAGPGGVAPANQQAPPAAAAKMHPRVNDNFTFVIECRRTGDAANPWEETRAWKAGSTVVNRDEINKDLIIDIFPLYSK